MKILIAEDDLTSRCMLEGILAKWDFEVLATVDGNEAWEKLRDPDPPQLAILDWMMPGMDGVEVCRRLRGVNTANPTYVILLTALGSKEDIVKGLSAGADDYLTKPFDNDELHARIDVGRRFVELQASLVQRVVELQGALDHVKILQGILPICMYCHKIRTDQESWERIEKYISERSGAEFSHSLCPECLEKHHPDDGD